MSAIDALILARDEWMERALAAERERDELKRRWEEDNLCGICPYRIATQARIAQLEGATDIAHARGYREGVRNEKARAEAAERERDKFDGLYEAQAKVSAELTARIAQLEEANKELLAEVGRLR